MVICLERGADLHMDQLTPLPITVSCFSKIQIGFTFLVPAHPGSLRKRAVKWVCVCMCVLHSHISVINSCQLSTSHTALPCNIFSSNHSKFFIKHYHTTPYLHHISCCFHNIYRFTYSYILLSYIFTVAWWLHILYFNSIHHKMTTKCDSDTNLSTLDDKEMITVVG